MTWNFSRQNVKEQNGDDPSSDEKSVWAENGLDPNGFSIGNDKLDGLRKLLVFISRRSVNITQLNWMEW